MKRSPKSLGKRGEEAAVRYLKKNGYRILERNFCCRTGEIDVVASEGDTICFVEVKSRRSNKSGLPEYAITKMKKRRIVNAALFYLTRKRVQDADCRFDVMSIVMGEAEPEIELYKGAFPADRPLP
ncbi:MAG: YraN family protein [Planctomycetes bacterium]|nr:YraN family protein [Planctomycetota bacterium]